MSRQGKEKNGRFTYVSDPLKKGIYLRLTENLDKEVKEVSEGRVTDWIRQAVIEKLQRENRSVI